MLSLCFFQQIEEDKDKLLTVFQPLDDLKWEYIAGRDLFVKLKFQKQLVPLQA